MMTPKAHRRVLNKVKKDPGVTADSLKESLKRVNINVHESTLRKTLNSYSVEVTTPQKINIVLRQKFAKGPDLPQTVLNPILMGLSHKVFLPHILPIFLHPVNPA